MDRHPPRALSDEIDLYIRTYYSLLRSSGEVRIRALEEAHAYSNSSLHEGAREAKPDVAAFAYSAARLPECMPYVKRIVLGQSHEQFEAAALPVRDWQRVVTRGRRRPLRWDENGTLAVFVTSTSDIDDFVPIVTAYQIEWNKVYERLTQARLGETLARACDGEPNQLGVDAKELGSALQLDDEGVERLCAALGSSWQQHLCQMAKRPSDLRIRLLSGSFAEYQRASQRWWAEIEPSYVREVKPRRVPVYFVSSNTHSLINLVGGYARAHQRELIEYAETKNPENLADDLLTALEQGSEDESSNILYYLLGKYIHDTDESRREHKRHVQSYDLQSGIRTIESPGKIDVSAQIIELGKIQPDRVDPRVHVPGMDELSKSEAVILNIDYPLGMAAYHHLSRLAQGIGELRGIYVMGKAATLNGRVGDVMLSTVVHDEHSRNTYLYRNCFTASHVQPYLRRATVFDNQKALTVRGAYLQNRQYMSVFYKEGYTVLEMEAGPYLSAVYEILNPVRHPDDEIVQLANATSFDVGVLHYASDTPYSRRQTLLSKSLSYFGVESTYGCSIAILRRIFEVELRRLGPGRLPTIIPSA